MHLIALFGNGVATLTHVQWLHRSPSLLSSLWVHSPILVAALLRHAIYKSTTTSFHSAFQKLLINHENNQGIIPIDQALRSYSYAV